MGFKLTVNQCNEHCVINSNQTSTIIVYNYHERNTVNIQVPSLYQICIGARLALRVADDLRGAMRPLMHRKSFLYIRVYYRAQLV